MPATHSPMPARAWIVRLARVCWERKTLSIIVIVASVDHFTGCADAANNASGRQ